MHRRKALLFNSLGGGLSLGAGRRRIPAGILRRRLNDNGSVIGQLEAIPLEFARGGSNTTIHILVARLVFLQERATRVISCVGVRQHSRKRDICTGKHAQKRQRWALPRIKAERRFHVGELHTSDRIHLHRLWNLHSRFGQI
jgi:hypothetical protein